jgi:DNA-binding SARP family transcriptional activator
MCGLRISLFGCPSISHDGMPTGVMVSKAARTLLGYLALHHRRYHSRESLVSLLWAELPEDNARHALRTAVWRLRKLLEPDGVARGTYLISDQGGALSLNWNSDVWIDAAQFERGVVASAATPSQALGDDECARLRATVELYGGELLEGCYDDWTLRERERLRCLYIDAMIRLMSSEAALGRLDSALLYGRRILSEDPLREAVQRRMIAFYVKSGERPQAIAHYRAYEQLLAKELGVRPMPETRALYAEALSFAEPSPSLAPREREDPSDSLESVLAEMHHVQEQFDRTRLRLRSLLARWAWVASR